MRFKMPEEPETPLMGYPEVSPIPLTTLQTIGRVGSRISEEQNLILHEAEPVSTSPNIIGEPPIKLFSMEYGKTQSQARQCRAALEELEAERLIIIRRAGARREPQFYETYDGVFPLLQAYRVPLGYHSVPYQIKQQVFHHADPATTEQKYTALGALELSLRSKYLDTAWDFQQHAITSKLVRKIVAGPELDRMELPEAAKRLFANTLHLDWLVYGVAYPREKLVAATSEHHQKLAIGRANLILGRVAVENIS